MAAILAVYGSDVRMLHTVAVLVLPIRISLTVAILSVKGSDINHYCCYSGQGFECCS